MRRLLDGAVGSLYPGYFNLVMATGFVSVGFLLLGHRTLSGALLVVGLVAYPLLLAALVLRAVFYPRRLWADLVDPRLVFTFFTLVAGTGEWTGCVPAHPGSMSCASSGCVLMT